MPDRGSGIQGESRLGRRAFFKWSAREFWTHADELRGRPHYLLSDLADAPDTVLARLMPALRNVLEIADTPEGLTAHRSAGCEKIVLCDRAEASSLILSSFDGQTTIELNATALAERLGLDYPTAFARVREIFLRLVSLGVCAPINPPEQYPPTGSAIGPLP